MLELVAPGSDRQEQFGSILDRVLDTTRGDCLPRGRGWKLDPLIDVRLLIKLGHEYNGVVILHRDLAGGSVDVFLGLLLEMRGACLTSTICALVRDYAFKQLGVHRITANAYSSNPASLTLLKKFMVHEGTFREDCQFGGRWLDRHFYGLLRSDNSEDPA